mmetsp:Transcript_37978/g.94397  ORF Transcript_37978/g.94397 Transcript_37978/m.94397 type:complete len:268 (+) Transcript_37978:569-1372(+)
MSRAKGNAIGEVTRDRSERQSHHSARRIGPQHGLEHRRPSALPARVCALGRHLYPILHHGRRKVHDQRQADEGQTVRAVFSPAALCRLAKVEYDNAESDDSHLHILAGWKFPPSGDPADHNGDHLTRLTEHLRREGDVAQRLIGRRHGEHLADAAGQDGGDRYLNAAAAKECNAQESCNGVDPALHHEHQKRGFEALVVSAVGLAEHILLQHRKVGEREEDAAHRQRQLRFLRLRPAAAVGGQRAPLSPGAHHTESAWAVGGTTPGP